MDPDEYGVLSSMSLLSTILVVFFTMGIDRSVPRMYFQYKTSNEKKTYLGTIFISFVAISLIWLLLILLFNSYVALVFKSIAFYPYFLIAILTTFFNVYGQIPMLYLRIRDKAKSFISISLSKFIIGTLLKLVFVVVLLKGAYGAMLAGLIVSVMYFPLFLWFSLRIINISFDKNILNESLNFSIPLLPVIISAFVLNLSDRIFLERYYTLSEVGIYSLGYNLTAVILLIASSFDRAFEPTFYRIANSSATNTSKKNRIAKYLNIYITIVLILCFCIALFSKEIVNILVDQRYWEAYKITMLISLAYVIGISSGVLNKMIYQDKKTKLVMYIDVTGACINIILNFIFIPKYGMYGAAMTTILAVIFIFLLKILAASKCFFIPIRWIKISTQLFILSLLTIAIYNLLSDASLYYSILIKSAILIIILLTMFKKQTVELYKMIA